MSVEMISDAEMMLTTFEPKLKSRFIVEMQDIPNYTIHTIQLPTMKRKMWYNRKEILTFKFYDPIVPSIPLLLREFINGKDMGTVVIKLLGPPGDVVSKIELHGCQAKSLSLGGEMTWRTESQTNVIAVDHINISRQIQGTSELNILSLDFTYKNFELLF